MVFRIISDNEPRKVLNKTWSLVAKRDVKCLIISVSHGKAEAMAVS